MPPEPRTPDPIGGMTFVAPDVPPPQVNLGLTEILDHLARNADQQLSVARSVRRDGGMQEPQVEELNQRLATVTRLAGELQAELRALAALRPPDPAGPLT